MKWISFFLLTSVMFLNSAFSVYKPQVINGEDPRADLYQVNDPSLQSVANSTAALFSKSSFDKIENVYQLISGRSGVESRLCPRESSNQCSQVDCRDEEVTKISFITIAMNTTYLD